MAAFPFVSLETNLQRVPSKKTNPLHSNNYANFELQIQCLSCSVLQFQTKKLQTNREKELNARNPTIDHLRRVPGGRSMAQAIMKSPAQRMAPAVQATMIPGSFLGTYVRRPIPGWAVLTYRACGLDSNRSKGTMMPASCSASPMTPSTCGVAAKQHSLACPCGGPRSKSSWTGVANKKGCVKQTQNHL